MGAGRLEQLEDVFGRLGIRDAGRFADLWDSYGFAAAETVSWLHAGVPVDEPHIAAALAAAEWTPALASRQVAAGEALTFVEAVRQHPNSATYARDLRAAAS